MSSNQSNAILIFSKSPEPGTVKTRLRPVLTEKECLSFHLALLQDAILKTHKLNAETILYITAPCRLPFSHSLRVETQFGSDLGERMQNAFASTLTLFEKVVIIGIDSPTLTPAQIQKAFDGLDSRDAVFGPAEDGGYYLIGLRTLIPQIFRNIRWGGSGVLKQTLEAAKDRNVMLLDPCYDVDQPEDLFRLKRELDENATPELFHTRKWFQDWATDHTDATDVH